MWKWFYLHFASIPESLKCLLDHYVLNIFSCLITWVKQHCLHSLLWNSVPVISSRHRLHMSLFEANSLPVKLSVPHVCPTTFLLILNSVGNLIITHNFNKHWSACVPHLTLSLILAAKYHTQIFIILSEVMSWMSEHQIQGT